MNVQTNGTSTKITALIFMITKIAGPCVGSLGLAGSTSVFKETLPEHEANMSKHTS